MAAKSQKNLTQLSADLIQAASQIKFLNAEADKLLKGVAAGKTTIAEFQAAISKRLQEVSDNYFKAQTAAENYAKSNVGNAKSNESLREGLQNLSATLNSTRSAHNSLTTTIQSGVSKAVRSQKALADSVDASSGSQVKDYESIKQEILELIQVIELYSKKDTATANAEIDRRKKVLSARKNYAKQQKKILDDQAIAEQRAADKQRIAEEKAAARRAKQGDLFGGLSSVFTPEGIGRAIGSVTKFVGVYGLLQSAVNLVNEAIVGSIKIFANFESQIQRLAAVSNASTEELDSLGDSIRQTALETAFGVQEVSDLAISLAKLGIAAKDIPDLLTPVALAAQATGESLEQTGESIVKVINQFGLSTEQTITVASTLTSAINSSTLSLDSFGVAIGYVGPLAGQVGLSFQETASYLSVLSDNGFSASRAGTGLRKIFIDLKQPGEDISLTLQKLADRNIGLAQAEQLVGKTAAAQLVVLLRNLELTKGQISESEGLTSILIQNARANSTLTGQYNILTNTIEEFQIAVGGAITNSEILLDLIGLLSSDSEKLGRGYKLLKDLNEELGDSFENDLNKTIREGGSAVQFFIQSLEKSNDKKLREIGKALREADPKNIAEAERALEKISKQETKLGRVAGTLGRAFGPAASLAASSFVDSLFGIEEQAQATAGALDILTRSQNELNEAQRVEAGQERINELYENRLNNIKQLGTVTQRFNAATKETASVNKEIEIRESAINTLQGLRAAGAKERILSLEGEIQGFKNYKQALSEYIDPALKVDELEKEAQKRAKATEDQFKKRAARLKEEIRLIEARRKADEKAAEEQRGLGVEATKGDPVGTQRVLDEYNTAIEESNARASASILNLYNDFGDFARESQDAFDSLKVAFPEIADSIINMTYDVNDALDEVSQDIEFTFGEKLRRSLDDSKDILSSYSDSLSDLKKKFSDAKTEKERKKILKEINALSETTVTLLLIQRNAIQGNSESAKYARKIIDNLITGIEKDVIDLEGKLKGKKLTKEDWEEILVDGLNQALAVATEAINRFNDEAFENTKNRLESQRAAIEASAEIENDILKSQLDNQLITEDEFRNRSEQNKKRQLARENAIDKKIFEAEKKRDKQQALSDFLQAVASSLINEILAGKGFPANVISSGITIGLAGASYSAELAAINQRQFYEKRFADGGIVEGPSHAQGGVPFTVQGRGGYEMEGGEFIVNKRATAIYRGLLERINGSAKSTVSVGSLAYDSVSRIPTKFADGGSVSARELERNGQEQMAYLRAIAEATTSTAVGVNKPVRAFITQTDLRNNDLERRIVNKNSRL